MLDKLRQAAGGVFGGDEVDRILSLPLTSMRMELKDAFRNKAFTQEQFDAMAGRLLALDPRIEGQLAVVQKAMAARALDDALEIELNTPAKTTLWAAALTRMMHTGKEPIATTKLWAQMKDSIGLFNEGIIVSEVISRSLQNDEVTYDWGQPGTWFYHDPHDNHINLDLYMTLVMGFEHMRVVHLHEIGHSELSMTYPPRMKELYEKVKGVIDPRTVDRNAPAQKMTEEEQKALSDAVMEWHYRFQLWHMVEDNCVNQFASNMEKIVPIQNFTASWNHIGVMLQGFGEMARGDMDKLPEHVTSDMPRAKGAKEKVEQAIDRIRQEQERARQQAYLDLVNNPLTDGQVSDIKAGKISPEMAQRMFHMSKTIVWLSFYERAGLFRDRDKGWARFKVFKDDINRTLDVSAIPEARGRSAFDFLYDMSVGMGGISQQQPRPSDRLFGKERYRQVVEETSAARGALMEKIWDIYLAPYADVLMQEQKKQLENRMKNAAQQQQSGQQQGQSQQGQGQSGQGQSGQGQPGQGQPGQGQSGQGQPEQGENAEGQPQEGGAQGGEKQDLDEQLKEQIGAMGETPEDKREKEHKEEAAAQAQAGDKPAAEGQGEDAGGRGWDQAPDEKRAPKKVGEMRQKSAIDDEMSADQKKQIQEAVKQMAGADQKGFGSGAGRSAHDIDLSQLAKGDWRDFDKRAIELAPVVNQVARAFTAIRDKQKKEIARQSMTKHDFQSIDGDFEARFDRDRRLERTFKAKSGQKLEIDDFKSFQDDDVSTEASTIEMTFMIDGSGSMPTIKLGGGVSAMEAAMQSAAIMYLAARKAGIDSYIVMWGNATPLVLATPTSDYKEVGRKLEAMRNGTNSGTDLSPGISNAIKTMAEHRNRNGTISGSSHLYVFSDGDIGDFHKSVEDLTVVAQKGHNISVDVAVYRPAGDTAPRQMDRAFQQVIDATGSRNIGVIRGHDANEIPRELARNVLKRVSAFKIKTEPDAEKRRRLKQLHDKLKH